MASKTTIHVGKLQDIPEDSSPGLVFLRTLLPVIDDLNPTAGATGFSTLLLSNASFVINGGPPVPVNQVIQQLEQRSKGLRAFGHDLKQAWDVEGTDGKRTVLYESVSTTVFKHDPERKETAVEEFGVLELVEAQQGAGRSGLRAAELKSWFDPSPVMMRAKAISEMAKSGPSE